MAAEQQTSPRGYGGAMGQSTAGSFHLGQPGAGVQMHFHNHGPTMYNNFAQPGNYSVTANFGGNMARTFEASVNPTPGRHVHFAGDTGYSKPRDPFANMPRESTPYPRGGQSHDVTLPRLSEERLASYFQP